MGCSSVEPSLNIMKYYSQRSTLLRVRKWNIAFGDEDEIVFGNISDLCKHVAYEIWHTKNDHVHWFDYAVCYTNGGRIFLDGYVKDNLSVVVWISFANYKGEYLIGVYGGDKEDILTYEKEKGLMFNREGLSPRKLGSNYVF